MANVFNTNLQIPPASLPFFRLISNLLVRLTPIHLPWLPKFSSSSSPFPRSFIPFVSTPLLILFTQMPADRFMTAEAFSFPRVCSSSVPQTIGRRDSVWPCQTQTVSRSRLSSKSFRPFSSGASPRDKLVLFNSLHIYRMCETESTLRRAAVPSDLSGLLYTIGARRAANLTFPSFCFCSEHENNLALTQSTGKTRLTMFWQFRRNFWLLETLHIRELYRFLTPCDLKNHLKITVQYPFLFGNNSSTVSLLLAQRCDRDK